MNKRKMTEGMTAKQKAAYYWSYYKWFYILAAGAVILAIFIGITIHRQMNREIILHLTLVNANGDAVDKTEGFNRFLKSYGYSDHAEIEVDGKLTVNLDGSDVQSANTLQLLAANFLSGDIDIFVSDQELFEMESKRNAFLGLEDLLTEEQAAALSDLFWYGTDPDTGAEVPFGIRLSGCPIVTEEGLYEAGTEPVLGVSSQYGVEAQDIVNFIEYITAGAAAENRNLPASEEPAETAEKLVDASSDIKLHDIYKIDFGTYGKDSMFELMFFDGEFSLYVNKQEAAKGTYTKNGNEVVLLAEDDKGNTMTNNRLIADADRLLFEESMCQGTVPEGETFDASVYMVDGIGTEIRYTFKKDGTYQVYEKGKSTKEENAVTLEGTYKRKGQLIEQVLNGNELLPLYVYRDHVFTSYYTAADEEDS